MPKPASKNPRDQPDQPPTREDAPFVGRRLTLLLAIFAAVAAGFGLQIYRLTVFQGEFYRRESENNFRTEVPIVAPRGKIHDRNNRPLAINERVFDVGMSPFNLKADEIATTIERLARLLDRPRLTEKTASVVACRPRWNSVTLAGDLQLDEVLPVLEQGFQLPGVIVQRSYRRRYPAGEAAGNVTGHVGGISERELALFEQQDYLRTEKVGKFNAELRFEELLHGAGGMELIYRDARGKPRSIPQILRQAQPGATLVLTLDLELQNLAHALLEGQKGVIVAMDPRDGSVLAMAQRPGYDPNRPSRGSQFNKIIQGGSYPPGSTFKIVTASAGLAGGQSPDETVYCDGAMFLGRWRFPCHLRWGHEEETMYEALQHSCNVFFYTWANRVGAQAMIDMSSAYGFGDCTGFDLATPGQETNGRLGRVGIDRILSGSVLHLAIGQGELISVSPMQVARAYAALCNGGKLMRPRIVKEVRNSIGERIELPDLEHPVEQGRLPLTDEQRAEILEGLRWVVQKRGGTASRTGFKEAWHVAGKTGTAETGVRTMPAHAWFCGFAPLENPEILILVLVEQAGHGGEVAAPLARQMMAAYFGEPEPEIVPVPTPEPTPVAETAADPGAENVAENVATGN